MANPQAFDCGSCNCNENHEQPFAKWTVTDVMGETINSRRCLRWEITSETAELWSLYEHYDKGILLVTGGIYDQPAKYLEAMKVMANRLMKVRAERAQDV